MTMDQPTPGSTPPPTWTPDPAPTPAAPPPAAPTFAPPASFAPAPLVATTKPRNRASLGTALLLVGALVAIGGVAFAVGRVTAPTATAATNGLGAGRGTGTGGTGFGGNGGAGAFGGAGRNAGGLSVTGTVVSIDANTIQLKLANGTSETLNLGSSVTYRDSTAGSASDVTAGATVEIGLSLGAGTGPTSSGQPRPSGGFGGGFGGGLTNATVGTITVVK